MRELIAASVHAAPLAFAKQIADSANGTGLKTAQRNGEAGSTSAKHSDAGRRLKLPKRDCYCTTCNMRIPKERVRTSHHGVLTHTVLRSSTSGDIEGFVEVQYHIVKELEDGVDQRQEDEERSEDAAGGHGSGSEGS